MPARVKKFHIRSKIWIEDGEGNVVFGEGRYRILDAVDRLQSLQAASKELKMGYRALWGRIKASEKRIGQTLVVREGRGSRLTPFAAELMVQYRKLLERVHRESDEVYASLFSGYLDQ